MSTTAATVGGSVKPQRLYSNRSVTSGMCTCMIEDKNIRIFWCRAELRAPKTCNSEIWSRANKKCLKNVHRWVNLARNSRRRAYARVGWSNSLFRTGQVMKKDLSKTATAIFFVRSLALDQQIFESNIAYDFSVSVPWIPQGQLAISSSMMKTILALENGSDARLTIQTLETAVHSKKSFYSLEYQPSATQGISGITKYVRRQGFEKTKIYYSLTRC